MPRQKFDRSLLPAVPDVQFEAALWDAGHFHIAGVDEAGRGALAGPVAAAAVILPPAVGVCELLWGVRDSKVMNSPARDLWAERIRQAALAHAVGFASNDEIDRLGIVPATRLAVQRAIDTLPIPPEHLLVDYLDLPEIDLPQTSLVKGDARVLSIAAASILAKTARDARMAQLDLVHPGYDFAVHKGYGTPHHRRQLRLLGPCPVHRLSFTLLSPEVDPMSRLSAKFEPD